MLGFCMQMIKEFIKETSLVASRRVTTATFYEKSGNLRKISCDFLSFTFLNVLVMHPSFSTENPNMTVSLLSPLTNSYCIFFHILTINRELSCNLHISPYTESKALASKQAESQCFGTACFKYM